MTILVFSFLSLAYLLSSILVAQYSKSFSPKALRLAKIILSLALFFHWGLLAYSVLSDRQSLEQPSVYLSSLIFSALANSFFCYLLYKKKFLILAVIGIPVSSVFIMLILLLENSFRSFDLPSVWLWTHIFLMITGEVLFFFAAIAGGVYLITARNLHEKSSFSFLLASAPLPVIDRFVMRFLVWGWSLMTLGLILGFIFAKEYWTNEWWLDAKILFAMVTWSVYGLFLGFRIFLQRPSGIKSAWFVVLSFIFVFVASFGIDIFFNTQHSALQIESSESP